MSISDSNSFPSRSHFGSCTPESPQIQEMNSSSDYQRILSRSNSEALLKQRHVSCANPRLSSNLMDYPLNTNLADDFDEMKEGLSVLQQVSHC